MYIVNSYISCTELMSVDSDLETVRKRRKKVPKVWRVIKESDNWEPDKENREHAAALSPKLQKKEWRSL